MFLELYQYSYVMLQVLKQLHIINIETFYSENSITHVHSCYENYQGKCGHIQELNILTYTKRSLFCRSMCTSTWANVLPPPCHPKASHHSIPSAWFEGMLIMIFALKTLTVQSLNPLTLPHVWETQCLVSLDMSGLDKQI